MKNVITAVRRKKMAEATHTTGKLAKAKWIALGSGGVDSGGNIITPLAENVKLNNEVIRKEYTSSAKTSDTSYEYVIDDIDSVVKAMTEQGVMDLGYGYIGDRDSLIDTYTGGLNVLTGITSKTARDMISLGKTDDLKALIQERMNGSAIALTGQAAFAVQDYIDNPTQDGLNTMNKVLGDTLSEIDASSIRLGTIYEELGIKYSRLDDTHTRLLSVQDSLTEAYADKLGADPYEAIMEMVSNQYSYNAALQVGSKLMETSLFDFMR